MLSPFFSAIQSLFVPFAVIAQSWLSLPSPRDTKTIFPFHRCVYSDIAIGFSRWAVVDPGFLISDFPAQELNEVALPRHVLPPDASPYSSVFFLSFPFPDLPPHAR